MSRGSSHYHDGGLKIGSIHAEHHACTRLPRPYRGSDGLVATVLTLTRSEGVAKGSRPCMNCLRQLHNAGVARVQYLECSGPEKIWRVANLDVSSLYESTKSVQLDVAAMSYARHMKIPSWA